ncbi:MAG: response regulator transcription factor [Bacteroidales bacterium]|nr:response regulator transcription factor [Bacteroidales bacterium]
MKTCKIIIAEPSPIIAAGLCAFFEDTSRLQVLSVIDNIDNLHEKMIVYKPDLLIVNPLMIGLATNNIKQIAHNYPSTILVAFITTYIDKSIVRHFKETIEISDNKQKIINKIFNMLDSNDESSSQSDNFDLSNREIDVLVCVAKGMTNKDISDMLNISVHTVITHRKNIVKKTGIKSVSGLTVYALLNNLVDESEIYE